MLICRYIFLGVGDVVSLKSDLVSFRFQNIDVHSAADIHLLRMDRFCFGSFPRLDAHGEMSKALEGHKVSHFLPEGL